MPLGFPYMEGNSIHREQHCLLRNSAWSTDGFLSGAHVCNNELNTDPGQPDRVFLLGWSSGKDLTKLSSQPMLS